VRLARAVGLALVLVRDDDEQIALEARR